MEKFFTFHVSALGKKFKWSPEFTVKQTDLSNSMGAFRSRTAHWELSDLLHLIGLYF